MAVATTGAIFKGFEFDGQSSKDYGIYITGAAVYNAPQRDVEMVSIPGRNGSFALDKGRFENIEVTYPAGVFAYNEADFAQAVADLRNYLCSRRGYCRLVDEYNPTEYRLAIYKSGLEVDPFRLEAGEFNITFDCKPQRYLMSGESAIDVSSGDTVLNPTLFEARPMLEVEGYGTIAFNGYEIKLENAVLGDTTLAEKETFYNTLSQSILFPKGKYNTGDTITVKATAPWEIMAYTSASRISGATVTDSASSVGTTVLIKANPPETERGKRQYETRTDGLTFTAGTYETKTNTMTASVTLVGSTTATLTPKWTMQYESHDADYDKITFTFTNAASHSPDIAARLEDTSRGIIVDKISVDSTLSILGTPTYIDCDLGEVYMISGDTPISLNSHIDLGSDLPKLSPGANEFAYDNTVTDLKLIPRWWCV